jgi:hypothetical protein
MISYEDLKEEVMMASLSITLLINSDTLQLKFRRELLNISKDLIIMIQPVKQADTVNTVNMVKIYLEEINQDMKTWLVKNFAREKGFMTQF